jgi:hypothetical protein
MHFAAICLLFGSAALCKRVIVVLDRLCGKLGIEVDLRGLEE